MNPRTIRTALLGGVLLVCATAAGGQVQEAGAGVTLDFVEADARAVVQALARYLDRPVVYGQVAGARITMQSPRPVARGDILALLRPALAAHNLELAEEGSTFVLRARQTSPGQAPVRPPSAPIRSAGGIELFAIRLRHARAADVAATVNALYGRASALGEIGARPATLNSELRDNRNSAYAGDPAAPPPPQPGRSGQFEGQVTIVPDARTNSLLVRASRTDFELIQAAVQQVDLRPLQVIIEVMIAEVRRNSDFSYALSAAVGQQALRGRGNETVGGSSSGADRQDIRSDLTVRATGIGGVDLALTLRAGVQRGAASILSRPILFAANNERAEILVGDQRPFVQLQRTTDGGSVDQVVQYKDVGTRLSVLPTISGDGYVQLQVTQEVNNATRELGVQDAPVISTRTIETSLLVRDGETAVLGGLAQAIRERGSGGIPVLSSIPVIGGIFGSKTRNSSDTELFVFLTPRVVRDDADLDSTVTDIQRSGRAGRLGRKPPLILPQRNGARATNPAATPAAPAPRPDQPGQAAAPGAPPS